jgi:putative nucleotidyltransferase with HDIG domain
MLSGKNSAPAEHYTSPEHLHIGLYVHIDLPWFRHPFTLNSFKISSEKQISELRALKKQRFRYDATLSESLSDTDSAPDAVQPVAPVVEIIAEHASRVEPAIVVSDLHPTQLKERRLAVARAEKSFTKALGVVRRLNGNLQIRPRETLEEMNGFVDQMVRVFLERPEVTLQFMGENCGGEEAYHHCLNVSVLCLMLAKALKLSHEQARTLGSGALLHDIGANMKTAGDVPARHIEHGAKTAELLGLDPEIMSIIMQHHEFADGSGFPLGLKLEKIAPLARIVSLVNFYDNLCNPLDFAEARTPHEALAFIFARLKNKFDGHILHVMIHALGVYPPGSIVKLSDDAIGMVVSVNPHKPLRPWVLLYDEKVPKAAATMLNLEAVRGISIAKSIRPALLPPPVYAYLSPRKRITYFFDGGLMDSGSDT